MRGRDFIILLGTTRVRGRLSRGRSSRQPEIGHLHGSSPAPFAHLMEVFRDALKESGYIEGQNVAIEYRWANGQYDRLSELASDLVKRNVAVMIR